MATTLQKHSRLLFVGTPEDRNYLQHLKGCVGTASVALLLETPSTFIELVAICRAKNATAIVSTSPLLLKKLIQSQANPRSHPSIDNYAGSLFTIPTSKLECVFLAPLEQLVTVSYGKFLSRRFISKLIAPETWLPSTKFNWSLFDESTFELVLRRFSSAAIISIDIETFSHPPAIRCIGFTALYYVVDEFVSESYIIPCDSLFNLSCIRQLCALPIPKVLQNGKYDCAYLQSYNSAPAYYLWDTAEVFHSWYSELPKDLAALNAFFVRDAMYWKDLADTSDLNQYYLYCAKDSWANCNVLLAWFAEAPQWALDNYANTFPLQFPCHLAEMTGIARDIPEMEKARADIDGKITALSKSLDTMLGVTGFNVNSPVQMKQLLTVLGCKDLEDTGEKNLRKAAFRHALNNRIVKLIVGSPGTRDIELMGIRQLRKLKSTYLRIDSDATGSNKKGAKEFHGHFGQHRGKKAGRVLYSLNPHGTDTGRLASKEHHFWCGLQIQNIPRGLAIKRTFIADTGFRFGECDLEQAESRDTAYIAGDENLIEAVTGTRDFHSFNASAFFGVPYASIYDDGTKKILDKILRDLAKRVNHGANYNMGAGVLVDTMGDEKSLEAKRLLKLPRLWTLRQVAEYLLSVFHKTYPAIKKIYYPGVMHEVQTSRMISSKAVHDVEYQAVPSRGLVRYCFDDPSKSKSALNAYVAHPPQSLNAMTLNRAWMKVFYEIALDKNHSRNFKLLAQIHDSILFQFREGFEFLADEVKRIMEIPVTVKGYDGITRTFTVPATIKAGFEGKGAYRWSETE